MLPHSSICQCLECQIKRDKPPELWSTVYLTKTGKHIATSVFKEGNSWFVAWVMEDRKDGHVRNEGHWLVSMWNHYAKVHS